jgi:hypothetical protein
VGCREYCLKDSACAAWTFDFTDPGHLNTSQCILSESPAKADVAYNYSEAGECTKNTSVSNFAGLTAHAGQAPPLATSTKAPEGMLRKPFDLPSAKNVTRNCSAIFPNTCANRTKLSGGASAHAKKEDAYQAPPLTTSTNTTAISAMPPTPFRLWIYIGLGASCLLFTFSLLYHHWKKQLRAKKQQLSAAGIENADVSHYAIALIGMGSAENPSRFVGSVKHGDVEIDI